MARTYTWGFYCDSCSVFFDLVEDGKVNSTPAGSIYIHKACGHEARYISYKQNDFELCGHDILRTDCRVCSAR